VALLTRERRVGSDVGIEVTSEYTLDKARSLDLVRLGVGQLNPIVEEVIGNPVNENVAASATAFKTMVDVVVASELSAHNPVVLLSSEDFTSESELVSTTHSSKFLHGALDLVVVHLSEVNTSPCEHLSLFFEVRDTELVVFSQQGFVFLGDVVVGSIEKVFSHSEVLLSDLNFTRHLDGCIDNAV
jgi:hypothetical protein